MQYVADATFDDEISDSLSAATRRGGAVFAFRKFGRFAELRPAGAGYGKGEETNK